MKIYHQQLLYVNLYNILVIKTKNTLNRNYL